jgi:glycosyltransferase involved in cell wall biosynthesis
VKIAIIYDVKGWAQHRYACGIQEYAPPETEVQIMDFGQYITRYTDDFDVVYCLSLFRHKVPLPRPSARLVVSVASHGWMHSHYNPADWRTKGLTPSRNSRRFARNIRKFDAATCRNEELTEFTSHHCPQVTCIPAGVDTERFVPNPNARRPGDGLTVGWCGQQAGSHPKHFKGHAEILLPLQERLKGLPVEWRVNTSTYKTGLSAVEMCEWYRRCDVFICTALSEGTPNPPFEAAACGCAVVSTDVGQVSEWEHLRDSRMIIPTPMHEGQVLKAVEAFAEILRFYVADRPVASSLVGGANRLSILRGYDYRIIAPRVCEFLAEVKKA